MGLKITSLPELAKHIEKEQHEVICMIMDLETAYGWGHLKGGLNTLLMLELQEKIKNMK